MARPLPDRRRGLWRVSADRVLPGVLFLLAFAGHLLLSRAMAGPTIQTDEVGYLGEANLFGHGVGLLYQAVPYHPGYGALLAPVAARTSTPGDLYRYALVLNALAFGGLAVAAYLLARRLMRDRSPVACATVAVLVSLYPAFLGYGNVATEASVFIAVCTCTAVAAGWAAAGGSPVRWAVAGLLAGACYCLHPIGPAAIGAVVGAVLVLRQPRVRYLASVAASVTGAGITTAITIVLNRRIVDYTKRHLLNPGVIPRGVSVPAQSVITRSQNLLNTYRHPTGNLVALLYEAAGQSWYLAVATGGIAVLGTGVALRSLWRLTRGTSRAPRDVVGGVVGILAALGFVTSVHHWLLGANGGPQADMLIYGRFNEHLLAPVLVLGLCELRALRRTRALAAAGWAAAGCLLIGGAGWLIQHGRTATALRRPTVTFNVLGIEPVLHRLGFINVALISVIGGAVTVIGIMLATEWGLLVVSPLVAAAWLAVGLSGTQAIVHDSQLRTSQRVVLHALDLVAATVGRPRCVGYDRTEEAQWTLDTDQIFLPDTMLHPFDSAVQERPCGDVVLSDRLNLETSYPGARLMAAENYEHTRLWVLPGRTQIRLIDAGLLLPPAFPVPLPPLAFRSRIAVVGPGVPSVAAGQTIAVTVDVTHAGAGAPWPSRYGLDGIQSGWVALVGNFAKPGAPPVKPPSILLEGGLRADLPEPVWPGETVRAAVHVKAVDLLGRPLEPGRYLLQVGLVQEGVRFFVDQGDPPRAIPVDVR